MIEADNTLIAGRTETEDRISKFGSRIAIFGALIVALNIGLGVVGYLVMTLASSLLGYWAYKNKQPSQLQMYSVFILVNLVGLMRFSAT